MLLSLHPLVGTILLKPVLRKGADSEAGDDSSLELLLSSFAHQATLDDSRCASRETGRVAAARRLNWAPAFITEAEVCANLPQLNDDLEMALDELSGAGA